MRLYGQAGRLETCEISPTGMKIFPYKHPLAGIIFGASAHAFVASRVYVKMAELSEEQLSTAAKKADKTEKKVQRKNFRWEAVMIEHLNISV